MNKFDLTRDVPLIHNTNELKMWLKPLYIIETYTESDEKYTKMVSQIMNLLKGCFPIYNCREFPIRFKFNKKDLNEYTLPLRHFAINLIVWNPFVELHGLNVLDKSFIIDCTNEISDIENYINYKLITILRYYRIKSTTINYRISDVLYNLRQISIDFSLILGLNFSALTFIDMYQQNDEIRNIMESSFDETMQPYEIEQRLAEYQSKEIEIYKNTKDNPIGVIFNAGSGIKYKQFTEFTISEGLKPSIEGVTIAKPIENSTLLRGLDRPSYLYIDAIGARKSLIMNKKVMGNAGHFGKIVLLLARTLSMSREISDCNTSYLVPYEIKSKKHLKKINGKYFKFSLDDSDFIVFDSQKHKDVIGKKIFVRSAATCALGDHVCPKCVGTTASTNFDIADGLSAFESEEVTKVINQSILSTKHLLTTNSEQINFNSDFYKFFSFLGGEINPIINNNENVDNIEDYAIYINPEDIVKTEELDYDSLYNTSIYNGRFYIRNIKKKDSDDILIEAEGGNEIFLSEHALEFMGKGKGLIYFKDLDDDIKLFEVVIMNQELTKPLYELMNLLNKQKTDNITDNIDSLSQKFLDLLVDAGIDANVVAAELIINRLIRSIDRPYERPDFTVKNVEPYEIYTVRRALERNRSPLIGISFQDIKRQILSDELYEERNGTSFIDPFFWTEIPTDNLKTYSDMAKKMEF